MNVVLNKTYQGHDSLNVSFDLEIFKLNIFIQFCPPHKKGSHTFFLHSSSSELPFPLVNNPFKPVHINGGKTAKRILRRVVRLVEEFSKSNEI